MGDSEENKVIDLADVRRKKLEAAIALAKKHHPAYLPDPDNHREEK